MPILEERTVVLDCSQKSTFSIGRRQGADIHLPHPTVSDHHAELRLLPSAAQTSLFLKDNKSRYGIYVEGHKVPSTFVSSSSHIQISVFQLVVSLDGSRLEVKILQTEEQYTLECHKLSYYSGDKCLVNNVDLVVRPGDFVGLFGPSGSGKTSLLRLLTGYYAPKSGSISVGGMDYREHFDLLKNFIAFVPQEDILHQNLTVFEALEYAAKLRLPQDVTESQLTEYIEEAIAQLELRAVQHQEISTLSGGQKKRVNIATELITRPRILIADEPDAGLDPHIQDQMMELFRGQAQAGNAVVMTTHTLENFFRFDYVAIIAHSTLCFFGPPNEALEFFAMRQRGASSPIEIFRELSGALDSNRGAAAKEYHSKYLDSRSYSEYFTKRSRGSLWGAADQGRLQLGGVLSHVCGMFRKNSARQLMILAHRHLSLRVAVMKSVAVYFLIPLVIALVLAAEKVKSADDLRAMQQSQLALEAMVEAAPGKEAAATQVATPDGKAIQLSRSQQKMLLAPKFPHVVPLTMVLSAIFCGTFIACSEISQERQIFVREHKLSVGIPNYLLSKIPFLFGITFIQMSLLMTAVSFIHNIDTIAFNDCVAVLTLTSWASAAVGLFLSAIDKSGRNSIILSIAVIVPQIVFSGAIGPDFYAGMNRAAQAVSDACISRWGFEGMLRAMNASSIVGWGPSIVDHQIGFSPPAAWFGIVNSQLYIVLAGFTVVFLVLSGIALKVQEK